MEEDYERLWNLIRMLRENKAIIHLHVTDVNGNPIKNAVLKNIQNDSGELLYTDNNGNATALIQEEESFTPEFYTHLDIESFTAPTMQIFSGNEYDIDILAARRNFVKFTSSTSFYVTKDCVSSSYSLIGGGEGGGTYLFPTNASASGGSGGEVLNFEEEELSPLVAYELQVGGGGTGSTLQNANRKDGGNTNFNGHVAAGGTRLKYTFNGATPYYIEFNTFADYGPGGGGNGANYTGDTSGGSYPKVRPGSSGGQIGGGNGGDVTIVSTSYPTFSGGANGTLGGGGGGPALSTGGAAANGGKGGNGFAAFCINLSPDI